ncbi:DUF1835 domain-containing protein [Candidatus Nephthysia bennettiae]
MTREAAFKSRVRERMRKTGESYAAARSRLDRSPALPLHVTNGDSTAAGLRQGGVSGEVLPWRDVLHEGPVPSLAPAALARVRARFLAEATGISIEPTYRDLRRRDARLAAAGDEVVLWFEADVYDQLQLVQVLDRLARDRQRKLTLVAVGEYPGVAHFGGLGELPGAELMALRETAATTVDRAALELARRAWTAFTAPNPHGLSGLSREHSPVLRHLGEALQRLLQEHPWVDDGLSLTERRILQAIAEGAATREDVFRGVWRLERRPFLGDIWCFRTLDGLRGGGLVTGGPPLALSTLGEAVLAGRADRVELVGLDRWIGGVHLAAPAHWRWDPRREALVGQGNGLPPAAQGEDVRW